MHTLELLRFFDISAPAASFSCQVLAAMAKGVKRKAEPPPASPPRPDHTLLYVAWRSLRIIGYLVLCQMGFQAAGHCVLSFGREQGEAEIATPAFKRSFTTMLC